LSDIKSALLQIHQSFGFRQNRTQNQAALRTVILFYTIIQEKSKETGIFFQEAPITDEGI
jgi:hypothetical protein